MTAYPAETREVDAAVGTKFIEARKALILELLDIVLPLPGMSICRR